MKLKKINPKSAIPIGVITLVFYLIGGVFQLIISATVSDPEIQAFLGSFSLLQSLVIIPIGAGLLGYALTLLAILIYNIVAKSYPISWEVKK